MQSFHRDRFAFYTRLHRWLRALSTVYILFVVSWLLLRWLARDSWWPLFMLNSFAIYLFVPAPFALLIAIGTHDRWRAIGSGLVLLSAVVLYGALFLPRAPTAPASAHSLTVMTYNMLGYNPSPASVIATLKQSTTDVISIQELSPPAAVAIAQELSDIYPYQVLDPQDGVTGLGVISRWPLQLTGETLPGTWVGQPQVLRLDFAGTPVTLVNAHPFATTGGGGEQITWSIRERERQAAQLVTFVQSHPGPLLMPIDFNAGDQSQAYQQVHAVLHDAWREGGMGLGHTFPGGTTPKGSRPRFFGVLVPEWLIRIDYIFSSSHWQADAAWLGRWDGFSDHRPVIARLSLREQSSEHQRDFQRSVIGFPGRIPHKLALLPGMSGVMSVTSSDGYGGFAIDVFDTATAEERPTIKTRILASPIVVRLFEDVIPNEVTNVTEV